MPLKKKPIKHQKNMTSLEPIHSMPLMGHLLELRKRLLYCFALFLIASVLSYGFCEHILYFLARPLLTQTHAPQRLIYTGLTEAFVTFIKVSCFSGALISLPFIFNQIWRFVMPALYRHEKKLYWPYFIGSPLLFFLGLSFAYFFVLPPAWSFFLAFQNQAALGGVTLSLEARIAEYVSLSMQILLAFSICFQLPILLTLLGRLKIIHSTSLIKGRRYGFLLILILSAVLTPPDVLSMIGLACPLYILYELSIYLMKVLEKHKGRT